VAAAGRSIPVDEPFIESGREVPLGCDPMELANRLLMSDMGPGCGGGRGFVREASGRPAVTGEGAAGAPTHDPEIPRANPLVAPSPRKGVDVASPPSAELSDTRLVLRPVLRPSRCRCGTNLEPGDAAVFVEGVPELIARFFDARAFCHCRCIRSEFLELLETMDAMVESPGEAMVSDLRSTYAQLALEFASLLHE
jgi:hypothetical protein